MKTSKQTNNIESLKKFVFKGQPEAKKKGINAYIYYRVSSLKQEMDGKSLEWQKQICEDYCIRNGFTVIEYFGGTHESAKTDEGRKEFMRMMESVKKGKPKISHIVVYSYDRFSRSGDTSLIKELRELGVKIHAVTQPVDDDTPSGRFFQSMHSGYAEWENAEREKKCKEGMLAKLKKGEVVTRPPIGYDKKKLAPGEKAQCVINEKGRLLRQAFYWAAEENISQAEVILRLRPMGLSLTPPQLSVIFRNIFYAGYISNNLLGDELVRGKHEPLISEEIFMKVNRLLDNNHQGYKINKEQEAVPLKGFCKCSKCGGSLTGYFVNKKYWYYKCKNWQCKLNVSSGHLNNLFTQRLEEYRVNPALVPALKKILEGTYYKLNESDLRREKPLKEEITKLKNELEILGENLSFSRGVTKEMYDKYFAKHNGRIAEVEKELSKMLHESSKLTKYVESALKSSDNMLKMWQLLDYRGKQRLQFLVFPAGMSYDKEKDLVLIPEVNKIMFAIAEVSKVLENCGIENSAEDREKLGFLYLTFVSSNFFWTELLEIIEFDRYLEEIKTEVWESVTCGVYDPFTGDTKFVQYTYVSGSTNPNFLSFTQDKNTLFIPEMNIPGSDLVFSGFNQLDNFISY